MGIKLLMIAEFDGAVDEQEAQEMLNDFREAVGPRKNYGIAISRAELDEIQEFIDAKCLDVVGSFPRGLVTDDEDDFGYPIRDGELATARLTILAFPKQE